MHVYLVAVHIVIIIVFEFEFANCADCGLRSLITSSKFSREH